MARGEACSTRLFDFLELSDTEHLEGELFVEGLGATRKPVDVSAEMLRRQVARGTLTVVVDVWAPWCGPCKFMGPEFEKVAQAPEPRARFVKLNSDSEQEFANALNIRGIPTMILFRDGRETDRVSGAMQAGQISAWLGQRIG